MQYNILSILLILFVDYDDCGLSIVFPNSAAKESVAGMSDR